MSVEYRGKMEHSEDSIHSLFRMRNRMYGMSRILTLGGLGLLLAAVGLLVPLPVWAEGLCILLGCLLFVGRELPAAVEAERVLDHRRGALPTAQCMFREKDLQLSEGAVTKRIPYRELERLVQDEQYLFCFLNRASVVMVERSTLEGNDQAVMDLVERGSGRHWEKPVSLLSLNLRDVLRIWDQRKK